MNKRCTPSKSYDGSRPCLNPIAMMELRRRCKEREDASNKELETMFSLKIPINFLDTYKPPKSFCEAMEATRIFNPPHSR